MRKKEKGLRWIMFLISLGLIVGMAVCLYVFLHDEKQYREAKEEYEELQGYLSYEDTEGENPPEESYPHLEIDTDSLSAINPDYVGILYVPILDIRYPMVQAEDNREYLHTTFEGQNNFSGCIFVDYEAKPGFMDLNTFIYGHNMKNGTMFGSLKRFYRESGLCAADPRFYIFTDDKVYDYRIFGFEVADVGSPLLTRIRYLEEYEPYTELIRKESSFSNEEVDLSNHPPIVTLYTCYGSDHTDKLLVHGALKQIYERKM